MLFRSQAAARLLGLKRTTLVAKLRRRKGPAGLDTDTDVDTDVDDQDEATE